MILTTGGFFHLPTTAEGYVGRVSNHTCIL